MKKILLKIHMNYFGKNYGKSKFNHNAKHHEKILENYFKFFGNVDVNKIIEGFPDEDKMVCNSLLSWANDGSHHINDDLYVDSNQELNKTYLDVFRRIF